MLLLLFYYYFLQKVLVTQYRLVVLAERNLLQYKEAYDIKRLTLSLNRSLKCSRELWFLLCVLFFAWSPHCRRATCVHFLVFPVIVCISTHWWTFSDYYLSLEMLLTSQINKDCKCLMNQYTLAHFLPWFLLFVLDLDGIRALPKILGSKGILRGGVYWRRVTNKWKQLLVV